MNIHPLLPRVGLRAPLARWLTLIVFALGGSAAMAQQQADPPARIATLSDIEGTALFAPAGQAEWSDAVRNRPIASGDRVGTDAGARAELHFGSAVLHLAGRSFVEVVALDDEVLQLAVNEGTVNARVRDLAGGEHFEIDTPQLALRATQPGDWRIDVDPARGFTRVTVHSGTAVVYGAGGGALPLQPGRQVAFTGRELAQLPNLAPLASDDFDRWAADRNRAEDQSIAARHLPRDVVGYQELDRYGSWAQDANYGSVWYPQVTIADWAPYRYGHWEWAGPWGWTWIDDAPWGFAPFHYGRWTLIGSRWAWVPGPRHHGRPVPGPGARRAFEHGRPAQMRVQPPARLQAQPPHIFPHPQQFERQQRQQRQMQVQQRVEPQQQRGTVMQRHVE